MHFKKPITRHNWLNTQKLELLEGTPQAIINNIANLKNLSATAQKEQRKLLNYYKNNVDRMQYKSFRNQGLMVGSGPMEAAHRTVIQTRMKRSGQRWTPEGAQAMLNLRVIKQSARWNCVTNLLQNAA